MTVITIISEAKCKDCKFCEQFKIGKMKRHRCANSQNSTRTGAITLKDKVCNVWEFKM